MRTPSEPGTRVLTPAAETGVVVVTGYRRISTPTLVRRAPLPLTC
jgi:hypothetical protein